MAFSSEVRQEVQRLLHAGKKIQAIKYVHETLNVSLQDAQRLVDAVELELRAASDVEGIVEEPPGEMPNHLKEEVHRLLQENKKIDAIRRVRHVMRLGLKRALTLVETEEQKVNPNFVPTQLTGCAPVSRLVAIVFAFVGSICLIVAFKVYYSQYQTIRDSESMSGTVVELHADDENRYAPVISYEWQGQQMTYTSKTHSSPPAFEVGEQVQIFVNRNDPKDIVIDSFVERWLFVLVFGLVGVIFVLITVFSAFIGRKF